MKQGFIGLNRARRPHNAIFVSFADATVPTECLEAAKANWTRVCLRENDKYAAERMEQACTPLWSPVKSVGRCKDPTTA